MWDVVLKTPSVTSIGMPMTRQIAKGCLFWYSCLLNTWNKFIILTVVLMTSWAPEAVSLGRYSSTLGMTRGNTAYFLCLASVSLPSKREQ